MFTDRSYTVQTVTETVLSRNKLFPANLIERDDWHLFFIPWRWRERRLDFVDQTPARGSFAFSEIDRESGFNVAPETLSTFVGPVFPKAEVVGPPEPLRAKTPFEPRMKRRRRIVHEQHWTDTLALQVIRRQCRIVTDIDFEPRFGHNFDLPDARHLIEMGLNNPVNEHLEAAYWDPAKFNIKNQTAKPMSQMDNAHFRELCVQRGGQNQVLHLKSKLELEPKKWLRVEWVAEQAAIDTELAFELVDAFKRLGVETWEMADRLINGAVASGKMRTIAGVVDTGLKGKRLRTGIKHAADKTQAVHDLSAWADLAELTDFDLDEPEGRILFLSQMYDWRLTYNLEVETGYHEDGGADETEDFFPESEYEIEKNRPRTANAFSTHQLYHGEDRLPYEIVLRIANASQKQLKQLAAEMHTRKMPFGTDATFEFTDEQRAYIRQRLGLADLQADVAEAYIRGELNSQIPIDSMLMGREGVRVPKRWWFFTAGQRSHFWTLYHERKAELEREALKDANIERIVAFMDAGATRRQVCRAIYSWRDGKIFLHEDGLTFSQPTEVIVDGEQIVTKDGLCKLWSEYTLRYKQAA